MLRLPRSLAAALTLAAISSSAFAQSASPDCQANVTSRGNIVSGRTVSTFIDVPGNRSSAHAGVMNMLQQERQQYASGVFRFTRVDEAQGIIEGEFAVMSGVPTHRFTYGITEAPTGGSRITATNRFARATVVTTSAWGREACTKLAMHAGTAAPSAPQTTSGRSAAAPTPATPLRSGGALPWGTEVAGSLTTSEDVHKYTFTGRAGQKIVLAGGFYVGGVLQAMERGVRLRLLGPTGSVVERFGSKALTLPATGTYTVQFDQRTATSPSPYKITLYPFNPAPERGPATVRPGETLEGELEHAGDEDVFTFAGRAGQEIIIQVMTTSPNPRFESVDAVLVRPATQGSGYGSLSSLIGQETTGSDGRDLEASSSERITLSSTGTHRLIVRAGRGGEYVGAYRVRIRIVE